MPARSWRPGLRVAVFLTAAVLVAPVGATQRFPGDQIFVTTALHKIHVTIAPAEWAVLQTSTPRGGTASGTLGGSEYRDDKGRLIHVGSGFGGYFLGPTSYVSGNLGIGTETPTDKLTIKLAGEIQRGAARAMGYEIAEPAPEETVEPSADGETEAPAPQKKRKKKKAESYNPIVQVHYANFIIQ